MTKFKVVKSSNPMIQRNYVGKTGTLISKTTTRSGKRVMYVLEFPTGVQAFYATEVKRVGRKRKRKK